MFQLNKISKEAIKEFFERNDIPLCGTKQIGKEKALVVVQSALQVSKNFAVFVASTMLNEENTTVETNFESADEACDMYENFLIGSTRTGAKN